MKPWFSIVSLALMVGGPFLFAQSATEGWIPLFDGKSLNGWRANENPQSFRVENGQIVADGSWSHLFYRGEVNRANFKNFELRADIKPTRDANSGIFFHTAWQQSGSLSKGYEVQVKNSPFSKNNEIKKTGSLYAVRNVYKSAIDDKEWFTLHIVVQGKRVLVFVNDVQTVNYTEPAIPPRTANRAERILSKGTFALQCHDPESKTYFKNIFVKPLPDESPLEPGRDYFPSAKASQVELLINQGYPLIDFHVHLKGGLTLKEVVDKSQRTGIFCGIAPNCGVGFPIDTNEKLEQFYAEHRNIPVFLAMQAEGREWVHTFKKESIAKFDYVFTDAMTFTDDNGKRMRLWMKNEVGEIPDPQAFTDMYVRRILSVLNDEKIDIYVNPTFLPESIASRYDELWTEERINKVTDALVKNGIALEINARYKIPSVKFIRLAKAKGVKFAFGTNNTDQDFANLDYCLQVLKECDLKPGDMFFPKPDGQKPIQRK